MARAKGKAYERGFQAGREQTLLALSILIDAHPRQLSEATIKMIGDDVLINALAVQLKRFAAYLEDEPTPRRRRRANAEAADVDDTALYGTAGRD